MLQLLLRYVRMLVSNRRVCVLVLLNLLLMIGNWCMYSSESSSHQQLTYQVIQLQQDLAQARAAARTPATTAAIIKIPASTKATTKGTSTTRAPQVKSNSQEFHATAGIQDQGKLGKEGPRLKGDLQSHQTKPDVTGNMKDNPYSLTDQRSQHGLYVGKARPDYSALRKGYQIPNIPYTTLVNCDALLNNNTEELAKAKSIFATKPKVPIYEETYIKWLENCEDFKKRRGYVTIPLTEEEEAFPLAFSISMYTDVELTERLLRSIYQPQNLYCIHIDIKSSLLIHRTIRHLVNCFDNVFIASHLDKIKWGDVSVLLPALNCMRDFDRYYRGRWKYYINLTGQELPLRSNWELVQIAKIFNGSNDIAGSTKRMEMDRVNHIWTHRWSKTYQQTIFFDTTRPKPSPPHNLTFFKGELHGLFTQRMIAYIVNSNVSKEYLAWCWDSGHPSEHYWNTLNYNVHLAAPGGYQGPLDLADLYSYQPAIRAKHWQDQNYGTRECQGKLVRGICIYGVGDLPWLAQRQELFANKFHLTYEYLAYDCMEQQHRERMRLGTHVAFNAEYYKNLPTVRYSRKDGYFNR